MFKYFGHENVVVMNGGFKKYLELGLKVEIGNDDDIESTVANTKDGTYTVDILNEKMVISYNELIVKIQNYSAFKGHLIDARNNQRFQGNLNF